MSLAISAPGLSSVCRPPPDFQAHTGAHSRPVCAAPIARRCCHRCPGLQRHHRLQQGRGHLSVQAVAAHRQGDASSDEDEGYNQVELLEDEHELEEVLHEAGKKLVVLEVQGVAVCETGLLEPELNWKLDQEAQHAKRMQACKDLQRNYYRIARDIPDVHFCEIMVDDNTPDGEALKARLGVTVLPTIQFFRDNKLLWQQEGYLNMEEEFNAGLLYYRDLIAGRTTGMVQELNSQQDLANFINTPDKDMLQVVAVTTELCSPCIKVYPAVIALARHLVGHASFARLLGDRDKGTTQLMAELGILEVPCFIFYRNGKLLGRHVGSSRSDLIGQILIHQQAAGLPMPPPPKPAQAMAPARAKATAGASRPKRNLWK